MPGDHTRRYPHTDTERVAPMFREDGQLWLEPRRLAALRGATVVFDTFDCFEYAGRLYEVWGRRADGCYWVGLMSARGVGREFRRNLPVAGVNDGE
jgi:hypothetical protein